MSIRAERFSESVFTPAITNFLAMVTGYGADTQKFLKEELIRGKNGIYVRSIHTREGRRGMVTQLQRMSDADFAKSKKDGRLDALRRAWGLDSFVRVENLRAKGYPDQREKPRKATPKPKPAATSS